jgi:hypothetical protein
MVTPIIVGFRAEDFNGFVEYDTAIEAHRRYDNLRLFESVELIYKHARQRAALSRAP